MFAKSVLLIPALALTLAGCATPRQSCIAQAQEPLRDVTRDIARIERDLSRGYRLVRVRDQQLALTRCIRTTSDGKRIGYPCQRPTTVTRTEPVAIDYPEQRARLGALQSRRDALERQARARIAQCQATYPAT